ncbi:MAG: T9SS type A sorting domain-containing protein, partial [Bacteroidetes bacterium]|nr:T9SS type A sorting domain-containing protein [Bacteroidota bacterium]
LFSVILFCESDQACQSFAIRSNIVNSWPVSIEEFKHNEVEVFPNPCSKSLYIYSEEQRIQKVLLIDMLGNIVYTNSDISNNKTEIPPLNFKGLYILQVELTSGENYFKPVLFN